ncbi:dTDP-4-dehydrorhamnose reductase [Arenibacter sp. N53]|uniref:dTDP-4-dehydrorhamnose reductase n=1 Tax=Arenibacter TaxID=178469 RepID=UPI000CD41BD9|nr:MULTISPECIES: dTDP-4-dehydrorhamnose reductase [Arenibacter]MCM4150231.1 dTDP-4-dehydrorhamnose reductase [Arenibacter sp. N53]
MEALKNKRLKLLITGANGQLGRCLQDLAEKYPNYQFHFKTSKELDITKKNRINKLFALEKYDYCINCAAYTAVDKAETDQENAFLVNAEAVKYLAEACKTHNTTFIHISTDFVFDGSKNTPYVEEDVPSPINVYGASKLKGEQYVQDILAQFFIIRTSWVYSEYGNNFVKTMLRLGAERDELSVVNDQLGSPTNASDLAEAILKIIILKGTNYGLYHFSNEGAISWFDFAKAIFEIKGLDVKLKPIPSRAFPLPAMRPIYSVLDTTKVKDGGMTIRFWKDSLTGCLSKKLKLL